MQPIIVIPAYEPPNALLDIVRELSERNFENIVIVDDGSSDESQSIFTSLKRLSNVCVLRHKYNYGKGQALKTALAHVLRGEYDGCPGVVSVDADGQHLVEDIVGVANKLMEQPTSLILGVRAFQGEVPFRSMLGNSVTRSIFNVLFNKKISDTQTGLRGIPLSFIPSLLNIREQRYDFELSMLVTAARNNISIIQVSITTKYINNNAASHFRPFIDSIRIYYVFLRFLFVSLLSFVLDYTLFFLLTLVLPVAPWVIHASIRPFTSFINFYGNKRLVFKSRENFFGEYAKYAISVLYIIITTTSLLYIFSEGMHVNVFIAKPLAEIITFFISFTMLRSWVFHK